MNKRQAPTREALPEAAYTFAAAEETGSAGIAPAQDADDPQTVATRLARELFALKQSGRMPEGFDEMQALTDQAFLRLLFEMPASAAVRVYHAEAEAKRAMERAMAAVAENLYARDSLPRPARAAATPVQPDFHNMTSAEFRAYEQQLKRSMQRRGA